MLTKIQEQIPQICPGNGCGGEAIVGLPSLMDAKVYYIDIQLFLLCEYPSRKCKCLSILIDLQYLRMNAP